MLLVLEVLRKYINWNIKIVLILFALFIDLQKIINNSNISSKKRNEKIMRNTLKWDSQSFSFKQ